MKKNIIFKSFLALFATSFFRLNSVFAETYNNFDANSLKSCGNGLLTNIPGSIPKTVSIIYTIIQIAVPIILVVFGSLDLIKGITAQKEDELKKGQNMFVKRLIYATAIFFVFSIVKATISLIENDNARFLDCAECFIKNSCD